MWDHVINHITLIQLSDNNVNGDHFCCTVVKWVFDINFFYLINCKATFDIVCLDEINPKENIDFG